VAAARFVMRYPFLSASQSPGDDRKAPSLYNITVDRPKRLMRIEISGMLSAEEVGALSQQQQAMVMARGWRTGSFVLLVDATALIIQPQDVVRAFQYIVDFSAIKAARIAVVRGDSLISTQTKRILPYDGTQMFGTMAEAEGWLFRDPPAAVPLVAVGVQ
jgi:hypothetical protein